MLSRSARIKTLLVIDTVFFFIEITAGYALGSLALVADSFHMLNDVCSLIVALYALKLAAQTTPSSEYTYGWQRAEVLGALINGVFLLALCLSICLEALSRFFSPPEVSSPKVVVIVGCLGLLSNIVGLVLFHEHGHSHSHSHSHSHAEIENENVQKLHSTLPDHDEEPSSTQPLLLSRPSQEISSEEEIQSSWSVPDDLYAHPAQTRANVVRHAQDAGWGSTSTIDWKPSSSTHRAPSLDASHSSRTHKVYKTFPTPQEDEEHEHQHQSEAQQYLHQEPTPTQSSFNKNIDNHNQQHDAHSHGHSHGSMNMRGVFLHVLGDALGNVGVIVTGLLIWFTTWSGRFYFDPAVSLFITIIIFHSALPLVRSASFILLLGVPSGVPLDQLRTAILEVPEILNVHELHVWSLSETKSIASVHVLVRCHEDFVPASRGARHVLHRFGIHSSTIQPEVVVADDATTTLTMSTSTDPSTTSDNDMSSKQKQATPHTATASNKSSKVNLTSAAAFTATVTPAQMEALDRHSGDDLPCLVQCIGDANCVQNACCPQPTVTTIGIDPSHPPANNNNNH